MCGIHLYISASKHAELDARSANDLSARGPDSLCSYKATIQTKAQDWHLTFTSSVLSLRGDSVQVQPVVDKATGSVFCWNGEAWSFDGNPVLENDTALVSRHLFEAINEKEVITEVLSSISGPYAFVLLDASASKLYFGRDILGRRSLLLSDHSKGDEELMISSIALRENHSAAREVVTSNIYFVDLTQSKLEISALPSKPLSTINKDRPVDDRRLELIPSPESVIRLLEELTASLRLRVRDIPTHTSHNENISPSKLAILFSGGLDCTLLARLAHDILPRNEPIDLLNVAFENPRVMNARAAKKISLPVVMMEDYYEACPDRMTGRSSFAELLRICPQRIWRFIAVNVSYEQYLGHQPTITHLMYPHNTEMDLSITSALYFAARGQGLMTSTNDQDVFTYTTTARVLLSGLGADELFGGYARHAIAFARGGYEALNNELELDFARIGARNLGRDDRVIAHWGRETRYPFLGEEFVTFALGLPAWEKCGFRTGKAVPKHFETSVVPETMEDLHPEKILLRCAMWQLGMRGAAAEKKRAIQFGARTAKMQGGRTKGTDAVVLPGVAT